MVRHWVLALSLAACGPVGYINQVTREASTAVDEARAAEASKYAPYWWTRATEYLHKARERAARADFQGANRFGKLASMAAQQATVDAQAARGNPELMPIDALGKDAPRGEPQRVKPEAPRDGAIAPAKE